VDERSQDGCAWKALEKLIIDSRSEDGTAALRTTVELVRKGIRPADILYHFVLDAAEPRPAAESARADQRLGKVLQAYQEAAESSWPVHENKPEKHLEYLRKLIEDKPQTPACLQVKQRLSEALQAVERQSERQ